VDPVGVVSSGRWGELVVVIRSGGGDLARGAVGQPAYPAAGSSRVRCRGYRHAFRLALQKRYKVSPVCVDFVTFDPGPVGTGYDRALVAEILRDSG
jgi:hypothetical protein